MSSGEMSQVLEVIGKKARRASAALAVLPADAKSGCLTVMAEALISRQSDIIAANEKDIAAARENGMDAAKIDRLMLNDARVKAMADGLRQVASQSDPVGKILSENIRPNGLKITKISVPFGVIGIIYEARPNVTADAAGICIKAGNAVILRGGKEAFYSNSMIAAILNESAAQCGLPDGVVQLIPWTDREAVKLMLKMDKYIDLVIPRGGESLIRTVVAEATMPVLKHYKGVCHLFVDARCDMKKAVDIIVNAKCSRPAVCNALETLLIDRAVLPEFASQIADALRKKGVEMRGDSEFCALVPDAVRAAEDDYYAEFLSLILAVKTVDGVDDAVEHINTYGSRHSDGIISNIEENIAYFTANVDSSTVYVNASTRFTDGGEFGMGAEIGISTDKLHARGPMGADELTTYKYIVIGDGQIR